MIKLTITFDNVSYQRGLKTGWGYSCFVENQNDNLLFDTGNDGNKLLYNLKKLNINPETIQHIFISHEHTDHTGGLKELTRCKDCVIWYPNTIISSVLEDIDGNYQKFITIQNSCEIVSNIYSTGTLGTTILEQSLIIKSDSGLTLLTGCAHSEILTIVKQVKNIFPDDVIILVIGGLHLKNHSKIEIKRLSNQLKDLGVKMIAPSHCTGNEAINILKEYWGKNFIKAGLGFEIEIDGTDNKNKSIMN